MFVKRRNRQFLSIILATGFIISLSGCQNQNAEMITWQEKSPAASVQSMSVRGKDRAQAYSDKVCVIPKKKAKGKEGISFSSLAQLCINITDQKAIYANNIYEQLYPASVTKLFSAYVILQKANLDDMVTISEHAANITESGAKLCGLKEGDQITLRSLLEIMLIYSGNDAALAAAEYVGGSEEEFVKMMNDLAASIGAVHSHFVNPHGLHDENHYTTAYDIYLMMNELVKDQEFVNMIQKDSCDITYQDAAGTEKKETFLSTNQFLLGTQKAPEGMVIIGGKTGTTFAAGACLAIYSKDEKEKEYIAVIMKALNGDDVFDQMEQLLSIGKS